jgi:uncharacterized protein (TIGR03083 family)
VTITAPSQPRAPALPREVAMRLAATEYQRFADLLRALRPGDWTRPTDCPGWDVRAMAAHALGMVEMAASIRENNRHDQAGPPPRRGVHRCPDRLQVDERQHMTPEQITGRFAARAPKAARGGAARQVSSAAASCPSCSR